MLDSCIECWQEEQFLYWLAEGELYSRYAEDTMDTSQSSWAGSPAGQMAHACVLLGPRGLSILSNSFFPFFSR